MGYRPINERFYVRKFLNRPRQQTGAHVIGYIGLETLYKAKGPTIEGNLDIADCRRVVSLDFSGWTKKEARNSLHKVRLLAKIMNEFAAAYEKTYEEVYGE